MFSLKVVEKDHYTVYEADAYNVGRTPGKLRSVVFWTRGGGQEPGRVVVDGDIVEVVYIMNTSGKTVDVVTA